MDRGSWLLIFGVSTILGTYLSTLQIGTKVTDNLLSEYDYIVGKNVSVHRFILS